MTGVVGYGAWKTLRSKVSECVVWREQSITATMRRSINIIVLTHEFTLCLYTDQDERSLNVFEVHAAEPARKLRKELPVPSR